MGHKPIRVCMSSNEKGTDRHYALADVLQRHPERWDFKWVDPGIDLVIGGTGYEIKERDDMVGSLFSGHLGNQRRQAAKLGLPCRVAVLSSLDEVMAAVPKVGNNGRRSREEIIRDWWRLLKGHGALEASNFEPQYLSRNHKLSMEILVARAYAATVGKFALPSVKAETTKNAMFRCLPRVGENLADSMERAGIGIALTANVTKTGPDGRKETTFTVIRDPGLLRIVPGMGQKTANGIIEGLK